MCWWVQSALNLNHNAFLGNSWSTWASLKILQHIIYAYKQSFLGHIMNLIKNSKNIHAQGWIEAAYIFTLRKHICPWKSDKYLRNMIWVAIDAQQSGLRSDECLSDTKKNNKVWLIDFLW